MYSGYASKYAVRVGVFVMCVSVNASCIVKLYKFGVRVFINVIRLSVYFYLYVVYILSVL